jgi:hypothetical protein
VTLPVPDVPVVPLPRTQAGTGAALLRPPGWLSRLRERLRRRLDALPRIAWPALMLRAVASAVAVIVIGWWPR